MSKFFPSYQLFIEVQDGEIISLPEEYANDREFACKFNVTQTTTSTPQTATINIYNLSDTNRKRIFFNWFDQVSVMKRVSLYAGYNEEKHLIFDGLQQEVSTYREGASLVTEIHGTCLGYAQNGYDSNRQAQEYTTVRNKKGTVIGYTAKKVKNDDYTKINPLLDYTELDFPIGARKIDVVLDLIAQFEELQQENGIEPQTEISFTGFGEDEVYNKPIALVGNIFDLLKEYVPPNTEVWMDGDKLYIVSTELSLTEEQYSTSADQDEDNGNDENQTNKKFKVLKAVAAEPQIPSNDILIINADTGLLNTPRFYGQTLQLTTLFEPRVHCGDLIRLESTVQPEYNRDYKVCGVTHSCEMGFGTSGSNTTMLTLIYPNSYYKDVGYVL